LRDCPSALKTFLEGSSREAVQTDLYTFQLTGGGEFRWTSGQVPLTIPSAGFPGTSVNGGADRTFTLGPGFGRSKVTNKIGIESSDLDIEVYSDSAISGNYAFAHLARLGYFDDAVVELDRFFAPPLNPADTSLGVVVWFRGRVAQIEAGRSVTLVKVKSVLNLLATTQFPPRIYSTSCSFVFGGAMCGYDRVAGENADGTPTGWGQQVITALSGSSQTQIVASYVPGVSPSPYIEGTISGLTGANIGANRTIRTHDSGTVTFAKAFLSPVEVGDTFRLLPGCTHASSYCGTVLNNLGRFGGFPNIPQPEAVMGRHAVPSRCSRQGRRRRLPDASGRSLRACGRVCEANRAAVLRPGLAPP
jgi:uncharacterized phage protein (TIGR02218 family)